MGSKSVAQPNPHITASPGKEGGVVHADDLIMVSVDDHLVEPPHLFEGRLPAKLQDRAPGVQRLPDGSDVWEFNGHTIPNIGLNAVAGRPGRNMALSRRLSTRCDPAVSTSMSASRT